MGRAGVLQQSHSTDPDPDPDPSPNPYAYPNPGRSQFLPDTAVPRTFSSAEWKRKFHGEYAQQDTAGQASQLVS